MPLERLENGIFFDDKGKRVVDVKFRNNVEKPKPIPTGETPTPPRVFCADREPEGAFRPLTWGA